jgi:propanol-preferring alcohol dehydrogenase
MKLGLFGFGAAAHIICQVAVSQGQQVYAFVRRGDRQSAEFALKLGACWAGPSDATAPAELDAALIFAPVGSLVPAALRTTRKGGVVVCAGIHMSDIPSFPYGLLWGERSIRSVANLTREDGELFFSLIAQHPITTHVVPFAPGPRQRRHCGPAHRRHRWRSGAGAVKAALPDWQAKPGGRGTGKHAQACVRAR